MQIVIDIPEDKIPRNLGGCTIEIRFCGGHVSQVVMVDRYDEESLYFTELPKGHGRLIDADELIDVISGNHINGYEGIMNNDYNDDYTDGLHCALCDINDAEVIISADKEDLGVCKYAPYGYDIDKCPFQEKGCIKQCVQAQVVPADEEGD